MRNGFLITAATFFLTTVGLSVTQSALALDAEGTGSVKGTILTAKGAPAVGCVIKIYAPPNPGGAVGGGRGGAGKSAGFEFDVAEHVSFLQAKGTPVATATTDKQGKFEVKSITAASYRYIAGNRNIGMAGGGFNVEAGKAADVQVKLNPAAPR